MLRRVHHVALNVRDLFVSRHFYGTVLGLVELSGSAVPATLKALVAAGKVANFVTPDGTVIDLFYEPELGPPDADPRRAFTRANHLAFDIAPEAFDEAVAVLVDQQVPIDHGPDGFLLEIRCDPAAGAVGSLL